MSTLFAGPSSNEDGRSPQPFQKFKAICVPLLSTVELSQATVLSTTKLLNALADEIDAVPDDARPLKPSLISYIFFPVSAILRRNALATVPDRTLEALLRILGGLAEHWWWSADAKTWEQLLKFIAVVLVGSGVDEKGKERALDEQTQLAAVRALHAVLGGRASTDSNSEERLDIYRNVTDVHVVGKTLDALLGLCSNPNSELALAALTTTGVLVRDFLPEELAPAVMPGVVSTMVRCALGEGSHKGWANGDVVAAALDVLAHIVLKAISDDICVAAGAIRRIEDLQDLASLVSDAVEDSAQPSSGIVRRTPSWLKGTASQLHVALNTLTPLLAHSNAKALRGLISMSSTVLRGTILTVPQSQPLLLSYVLALSRSDYASVASSARAALVESAQQPVLLQHLLELAHDALTQIPRLVQSQADTKLAHRLRQILAVCSLAEDVPSVPAGIGHLLGPTGGIEKWGVGLLSALEFVRSTQAGIIPEALLLLEGTSNSEDDFAFPLLSLRSPSDVRVQNLLEDTFIALGRAGDVDSLYTLEWLVSLGVRERSPRAIVALWCASLIGDGVAKSGARATAKYFKTARWMAKATAELWHSREEDDREESPVDEVDDRPDVEFLNGLIKVETSPAFPTPQTPHRSTPVWSPELYRAAALRVVAAASSTLQAAFAPLLLNTLYPTLHALVSSSTLLRSTAMATLHRIARATGFASPRNLLMANFDYALAGAAARLLRTQLDVDAAKVLHILIRLVGADVVDKMGDVVAECFERLDEYHGYEVLVERLVEVLAEVVSVVRDDVEARGSEQLEPELQSLTNVVALESVDQFLQWLEEHRKPSPPEESEDLGPVPRQDWSKLRATVHDEEKEHDHDHNDPEHQHEHGDNGYREPEKPQPTATHKLVHLVLSRSVPFLTHASALIRARILMLLTSAVPVLAGSARGDDPGARLLLPQIHRAWPFVLNRLADAEPFVVANAAGLVAALAASAGAGDFVKARIWEDVWPRFQRMLDALQRAESENALTQRRAGAGVNGEGAYAVSTRLYDAMLRTVDAVLRGPGGAQDTAAWDVALAFCRFLDAGEVRAVQERAIRVFKALRAANEDAVWLALSASAGVSICGREAVDLPKCLYRRWNIIDNAKAVFA